MADAISDMDAAAEQALEDYDRTSAQGAQAAQAHHVEIVYQLLKTAPYRHGGYYEPRSFATVEGKPAPDFCRPGDIVDVDPADVPDLPGLADVTPESVPRADPAWARPSAA